MKRIGIWMDKEKAHIVTLTDDKEQLKTLESEVEFYNVRGGSRSKTRWGPQQVVKDSTYLEREKHQLKAYFKKLAETVRKADLIYVFGPGDTKNKFHKEMSESFPLIAEKIQDLETADSMTSKQLVARVKVHFGWERV